MARRNDTYRYRAMLAHRGTADNSQGIDLALATQALLEVLAELDAEHTTQRMVAAAAGSRAATGRRRHRRRKSAAQMPPPQGVSRFTSRDYQRIARDGLRGGVDDALETAGSIAGSAFGPLGAYGGGLLARGLGDLLGLGGRQTGASAPLGQSPAQPVYVVMTGVSELLSELVSLTRAAQLRSAGFGIDDLTSQLSLSNMRAGLEVPR